ncbi:MAG: aspartate aminotransferase family protein [Candidatus Woesearchaeota archaeon]|nr:aspartate aminotransferase family protein [Candidatus Woesearchaeota archaeon]
MPDDFRYKNSMKLFREASHFLPGGSNSSPRLWRGVCPSNMPCAIFADKAKGAYIWDVDGHKYIDYRLGFGPVLLGHSHPAVRKAVHRAEKRGQIFALNNELEITVAKKIIRMIPCAEKVRFANSGTEATMATVRVARGYTKKDKIVKFAGHYHGTNDYLLYSTEPPFGWPTSRPLASSLGIPHLLKDLIIIEEWNNFESIEQTLRKHHKEIAAIICEPVMGNATVIPPLPGYLRHLRELCDKYAVVLIFDEVKTGFRLAPGGAQQYFKVTPDLAAFAKSLGNGYPIAAIAGQAHFMDIIGAKKVYHGGTYSSNPVSLTAASATLDILRKGDVYERIGSYGSRMIQGIAKLFRDYKIPGLVQGFPGMFQFLFINHDVKTYTDLKDADMQQFANLHTHLLQHGVMLDEDNEEPIFISASHSNSDLYHTLEAIAHGFGQLNLKRR